VGKQWTSAHGHRDDNMGVTAGRVDYGRGCGHKDDSPSFFFFFFCLFRKILTNTSLAAKF
jgi:hypothetical protein